MSERQVAVALRYLAGADDAPRVVARGRGELAARILSVAREHGVPVRSDADLVETLAAIEVGRQVPPELYGAIAEILAWVYTVNQSAK